MSVLALPDAKLPETHNRSPLQGDSRVDAFPGLKPWAVLLGHFIVKPGPQIASRTSPAQRAECLLRDRPVRRAKCLLKVGLSPLTNHFSLITSAYALCCFKL